MKKVFDVETFEELTDMYDVITYDGDFVGQFVVYPCETCGEHLAGQRHEVTGIVHNFYIDGSRRCDYLCVCNTCLNRIVYGS